MAAAKHSEVRQQTRRADDSAEPRSARVPVQQYGLDKKSDEDVVAVEEPLEIRLAWPGSDGIEQHQVAVTMRTPGDDAALASGFLFTEGFIRSGQHIASIASAPNTPDSTNPDSNIIVVTLDQAPLIDPAELERNFYISSSCGVCGKASIDAIRTLTQFPPGTDNFRLAEEQLAGLPEQLHKRQKIFSGTGGIHAAALFSVSGLTGAVFEDVGRHNAVDKLIGAQLMNGGLPLAERGLLVSGRASFELVQKACMAGCPMLAAIGAPSSLAIELAWESDMTLVGFLRDDRFNVYSHPSRIN